MSLLVDDIDDADREFAERHLATCEPCRRELDSLATVAPLLADLGATGRRQESASHGQDPAPGEPPPRRPARRTPAAVRRPRALTAAAAVIVAGVLVLTTVRSEPAHLSEVRLGRTESIAGGVARFGDLSDGVTVQLRMSGVRQPPEGGMYEVWLERAHGGSVSVGSFSPAPPGEVSVTLHGAGHLDDFDALVVTMEPDMVDPTRNGESVVLTEVPHA